MQLRLDPWAAEYSTAYHAESPEPSASVDTGVEADADAWHPIRPRDPECLWDDLLFLDGRRRVEARLLVESERAQVAFAAIGTYAIGAVSCCTQGRRRALFLPFEPVARVCALGNNALHEPIIMEAALPALIGKLEYQTVSTDETDADAVVRVVQTEMLKAEGALAERLSRENPQALMLCDGPRPLLSREANLVGYLKTIHTMRISDKKQLEVICSLEQGERSPVYLVRQSADSAYFEWFLRLRDPRPWLYSLAGMVRLQAYAGADPEARLETVCHLADYLTQTLPRYATRGHQDPRAPQQLLPIRALEAELGRRMGSPDIIRRRVTRLLAQGFSDNSKGGASA